jgi:3',5'-cyclic AMP phosphodiesterase CpdA
MIVIAHLSDVHIDSEPRSADRTRAVMSYVDSLPYDLEAVLVTGDIADHAQPAEYELCRELLTSRHPVLICPGNHDDRAAFREHLLRQPGSPAPVNQVLEAAGFAVALCDSSIPGKNEGYLEDETLEWLDGVLTAIPDDRPIFVGFHHPPATLNIPFVDGIRQFGEERLADLASRHPNLVAFVCGHAHTPAVTTFAGRPLLVAPGVVSTSKLPWEAKEHPTDLVHLDLPPALVFHVLDDEGRLTSHYRSVPV